MTAVTMRCADCAHWVTHRCHDRNRGPAENASGFIASGRMSTPGWGECDRPRDVDSGMDAVCVSEGIGAELFTAPTFGCIEFAPAPDGWDHHRFHRRADDPDGRPNYVIDDTAHAEGRL